MIVTVKAAIVHELVKDPEVALNTKAQIKNKKLLDVNQPAVISLVDKIHDVYGTKENTCDFGIFLDNARQGKFPGAYESYSQGKVPFLDLTHTYMDELIEQAALEDWSTGGYIVCADYSSDGGDFVVITMIKKTNEIRFNKDLTPEEITAINLKKLHQAVRINKRRYETRPIDEDELLDYNYLSFISDSSAGAASYFIKAAGCDKNLSSSKATDVVYKYVHEKFTSSPALKAHAYSAKTKLTEFFSKKIEDGRPVTLTDISSLLQSSFGNLFENESDKESFFGSIVPELNSDVRRVPRSFNANESAVRRRTQVKYRSEKMSLNIDVGIIDINSPNSPVYWNETDGRLSILADSKLRREIDDKVGSS